MNPSFTKLQYNFFIILLFITLGVMFYIIRPFLGSIVLAGSFAIVFYPVYEKIKSRLGDRATWSALITVAIVLLLVLTPLVIIGGMLFAEARNLYVSLAISSGDVGVIGNFIRNIENNLQSIAPDISLDVASYVQGGLEWILTHLDSFFSGFISIIVGLFIMVIALFFLLRDGDKLRKQLLVLSPLDEKFDLGIISKIVSAVNSVVKGSLIIAIAQGAFASIGFAIFGLPNPIMWGVAAMLASFIPGIGTSLVTIPAIIFMFATGPVWQGIGLLVWAALGVGSLDNLLAPYVLNRGMKIHPFFILLSVLGGIVLFGPIGFIVGPITLAFLFALLDIYPLIIKAQ